MRADLQLISRAIVAGLEPKLTRFPKAPHLNAILNFNRYYNYNHTLFPLSRFEWGEQRWPSSP